ncbi:prepilin-type N-terminal cleavage/methylation domain-containing protein [Desulfitobacterium sp. Sab5]|uniref:type IV pilus modification PilV family protein n=1 Tax=Desulfitobacterium nosdiversum TaxID=3375356 RepID=UPI003CE7B451
MKLDNRGFTLVETIAALAIVAIVSSVIFQMFVLSGTFNQKAKEMDIANVIAVNQAEAFKNDPDIDPMKYNTSTYYNRAGVKLADSTGAAFRVDSNLTSIPSGGSGNVYLPDSATSLDLAAYTDDSGAVTDCDVQISEIEEQANDGSSSQQIKYIIKAKAHDETSYTELDRVDSSKIKNNLIPIQVNFPAGGTYPRNIYVTNNTSNAEAEFYVFNAQVENPKITSDQIVILNTVRGTVDISYVPVTSSTDLGYQLDLEVYRLNDSSNEKLLSYSANKYLH